MLLSPPTLLLQSMYIEEASHASLTRTSAWKTSTETTFPWDYIDGLSRLCWASIRVVSGRYARCVWQQQPSSGMHLTNVAIQRHSDQYDEESGGKWLLRNVKQFLITKYGEDRVNELMLQIQQLMLKPLIAVAKVMMNDKHCCELYGYDIIIDSQFNLFLDSAASTPVDYEFKLGMLDDVLTIVDMEKYLTGTEKRIGGFVLLYKGVPVNEMPPECSTLSYMGTDLSRETCLKYLAKKLATAQQAATSPLKSN
ncbi:tubulin-tyrosine ligase family protein [Cystoisospora suis]|uniref:Tubulin--tyrosine ligase-like protein 9 n=1 Tax=Cystoisospora suis TaxID=483139 RepID=A0A2C6LEZ4_9APIC|nr:tubulin-tyrosine ligase family protein [Cystoisospora suis]